MTSLSSSLIDKINATVTQLNQLGTIPSRYLADLADRLRLTFDPPQRCPRRGGREEPKVSTRRWKEKRAYNVYSDILDHRPDIYLAFILVIPPTTCRAFNVSSFLEQYDKANPHRNPVSLNNDARGLLQEISLKGHFEGSDRFKTFESALFPLSPSPYYDVVGANKSRFETCERCRE